MSNTVNLQLKSHTPIIAWSQDLIVCQRNQSELASLKAEKSIFGSDRWLVYAASGKPTVSKREIIFERFPVPWKDVIKRISWCMLNVNAPINLITRPHAARTIITPPSVSSNIVAEIWPFINWLIGQGVQDLSEVTVAILRQYGEEVAQTKMTRATKGRRLWGPTRFWMYARYLPSSDQLCQPPWDSEGTDDYLGPANWSAENATQPIHPQTMSALLCWSLAVVEDFSDTILSTIEKRDQLRSQIPKHSEPKNAENFSTYLNNYIAKRGGIPGVVIQGHLKVALQYIAAKTSVPYSLAKSNIERGSNRNAKILSGSPLVDGPLLSFQDQYLRTYIDYYEVDELKEVLSTACIIVIAYLSGMRSEECRGLQRGCCKGISDLSGTVRFEITAKSYKDALDSNGNAIYGGAIRNEPWHIIQPVAKAIEVIEALHDEEYLFSEIALNKFAKDDLGLVMPAFRINAHIVKFISWCNRESEKSNLPDMRIPDDPSGAITMRRFRRTLAWFIYRQPAGRISLGIQYGHLQGTTSDGYGSRAAAGLRDIFPMEEAFARADALASAVEKQAGGEFVSGPAADRYVAGVTEFLHRFQGKYLTTRQAAELSRDPAFRIFDNGVQPLACCYDSSKALCHPDREKSSNIDATPNLTRCDSKCPNIARTDSHMNQLKIEAKWQELQSLSELVPEPLRQRHIQRVAAIAEMIEKHESAQVKKGRTNG